MTRDVVTVPPAATVTAALETLDATNIRHLPVPDGGRLAGIASDRDLRVGRPE